MSAPLAPLRRVRSITEIVQTTIETLRTDFVPIAKAVLRYAGPWIVLSIVVRFLQDGALADTLMPNLEYGSDLSYVGRRAGANAVLAMLGLGVAIALHTSITVVITTYLFMADQLGRSPNPDELHAELRGRFGLALQTIIISGVVLFVGTLLLIIPGLYLIVPVSLIYVIRQAEGTIYSDAFRRSLSLTRGQWWFSFATLLLVGLIQFVFTLIGEIPDLILMFVNETATSDIVVEVSLLVTLFSLLTTTIAVVVSTLASIIYPTSLVYLYFSHRERMEGALLHERVDSILGESENRE